METRITIQPLPQPITVGSIDLDKAFYQNPAGVGVRVGNWSGQAIEVSSGTLIYLPSLTLSTIRKNPSDGIKVDF